MLELKLDLEKFNDILKILQKQKHWSAIIYYDRNTNSKTVHKLTYEDNNINVETVDIFQKLITNYFKSHYTLENVEDYLTTVYIRSKDDAKYKIINNSRSFDKILLTNFSAKDIDISTNDELEKFKEFLNKSGFFEQDKVLYIPNWYHTIFKSEKDVEILYPWEIRRVLEINNYETIQNILKYLQKGEIL